jgi:hypothetical protein
MFPTICTSRVGSPSTLSSSSGRSRLSSCRRESISGRAVSTAFPLQRDHAARDARDVEQIVDETHEMLHLTLDDLACPHALWLSEIAAAQQLDRGADRRQWIAQLVSEDGEELVLAAVGFLEGGGRGLERRGPIRHALFQLRVQALERSRLAIQLGEDADLGAQDFGHHRHRHVVHGTALVAPQTIEIREQQRRHEDDRRSLKARMLPDHRRKLVAIELRHHHVHEDDGHLVAQEILEGVGRRTDLDQVLAQLTEDRLVGQELRGLIIHQQDVDRVNARWGAHVILSSS